jgi:hypothetical protein
VSGPKALSELTAIEQLINPCGLATPRNAARVGHLAAMAGMARENVTRILNERQRRRLVSRLSGYYCLQNKTLLEHQVKNR